MSEIRQSIIERLKEARHHQENVIKAAIETGLYDVDPNSALESADRARLDDLNSNVEWLEALEQIGGSVPNKFEFRIVYRDLETNEVVETGFSEAQMRALGNATAIWDYEVSNMNGICREATLNKIRQDGYLYPFGSGHNAAVYLRDNGMYQILEGDEERWDV